MSAYSRNRTSRRAWLPAIAAVLAVCAAAAAQSWLDARRPGYTLGSGILFACAALVFAIAVWQQRIEPENSPPIVSAFRPARLWLLAPALGAGILAWRNLSGNRYSFTGGVAWLACLVLVLVSAWQPLRKPQSGNPPLLSRAGLQLDWVHLALLGVIAVGAFLRLFRLNEIPAEMGTDLPHNYRNIALILEGRWPIFFDSWPGREGLFFYLGALPSALFGLSHLSIKLTGAFVGILTIPVIYALGRELYTRELGLIAAALYAASHWAIITSRIGLRMALVPPLLALTWLLLVRGLRRGSVFELALSGLFLGLGLHSYNAFLAVPPLVLLWLVAEVAAGRGGALWQHRAGLVYLLLTACAVYMPLVRYSVDFPGQYLFRVTTRVTGTEVPLPSRPLLQFIINVKNALLMFNLAGDQVAINNIAHFRQLGFAAAVFLPLGLVRLASRPLRGYNLALFITLPMMLLPSALALAFPNEVPNAGRAIGALPAAILCAALGIDLLRQAIAGAPGGSQALTQAGLTRRRLACLLAATVLAIEAAAAYPLYFERYRLGLPAHNYSISLEMARVMDAFAGNGRVYIKTQAYWYDGNAVRAQLRKLENWDNEFWQLDSTAEPLSLTEGKVLILLHPNDLNSLEMLRAAYPRSIAVSHYNYDGQESFIAFYGER